MSPGEFLKGLLIRTPQEILVALLRLLLLLLLALLILLLKLWAWLLWLWRTKTFKPDETEEPCGRIPEVLVRRPDPCIYSQSYLAAQGLPVTWDNPDIWMARANSPGTIEPDSYHLDDDTDYLVSVRVHNASTDPAIGVTVRLVYRPWSFNSPDLVPVEVDASGIEVTRSVDVAGMGSTVTQFAWHTPPLAPGDAAHYCLQVHLSHPLDINAANNVGQENTQVYSVNPGFVHPGETAQFDVPLFNPGRVAQLVRFRTDRYLIDVHDTVELKLERATARARLSAADRLGHLLPTVEPVEATLTKAPGGEAPPTARSKVRRSRALAGEVSFTSPKSRFQRQHTRYQGFDHLRQRIQDRDYTLPEGMLVTAPEVVDLNAGDHALAPIAITIPTTAQPGERFTVNVKAENDHGTIVGGVTVYFEVEP